MQLSPEQLASYRRNGYLLASGLLSVERVRALLIGVDHLLCAKAPTLRPSDPANVFEEIQPKILYLQKADRAALAQVYDAMRKLSQFWSLIGGDELTSVAQKLTGSAVPGVVFRGCGIRLDIPGEDKWRSLWHQEYHSQMSSLNGVTAWFNLVPVDQTMGPVKMLEGSHAEGLLPVRAADPMNTRRDYTQTFRFENEQELIAKYPSVSFETKIGDVLFLHFLTVHESGLNRSNGRTRITCQVRYFDMAEPNAVANDWVGGWQEGGDFTKVHPDKVLA